MKGNSYAYQLFVQRTNDDFAVRSIWQNGLDAMLLRITPIETILLPVIDGHTDREKYVSADQRLGLSPTSVQNTKLN